MSMQTGGQRAGKGMSSTTVRGAGGGQERKMADTNTQYPTKCRGPALSGEKSARGAVALVWWRGRQRPPLPSTMPSPSGQGRSPSYHAHLLRRRLLAAARHASYGVCLAAHVCYGCYLARMVSHVSGSVYPTVQRGGNGRSRPAPAIGHDAFAVFLGRTGGRRVDPTGSWWGSPRPTGRSGGERSPGAHTPPRRQPRAAADHRGPAHPSATGAPAPLLTSVCTRLPLAAGYAPGKLMEASVPRLRAQVWRVLFFLINGQSRERAVDHFPCARAGRRWKGRARHAAACRVCPQCAPSTARGAPCGLAVLTHGHPEARRGRGRGLRPPNGLAALRG